MASQMLLRRLLVRNVLPQINARLVSTSKRSNDTAVADVVHKTESKKVEHKNWIDYGFSNKNKEEDRQTMHQLLFVTVTMCLVLGSFYYIYLPDYSHRDWAQREAFLELRRREKAGKPPVSPDYIDPASIHLPSDEELGDTEIII